MCSSSRSVLPRLMKPHHRGTSELSYDPFVLLYWVVMSLYLVLMLLYSVISDSLYSVLIPLYSVLMSLDAVSLYSVQRPLYLIFLCSLITSFHSVLFWQSKTHLTSMLIFIYSLPNYSPFCTYFLLIMAR